jgi:hypothetical protein
MNGQANKTDESDNFNGNSQSRLNLVVHDNSRRKGL